MQTHETFSFHHTRRPTRWTELAPVLVVLGLLVSVGFGLGLLWPMARPGRFSTLNVAQWLALLLLLLSGATLFVRMLIKQWDDQQKAEAGLLAAQMRFKDIFEQFPLSIQVVRPDGFTSSVNHVWEELFGATLDAISHVNLLTDRAIQESGVIGYLNKALAGEMVVTDAKLYNILESWPFSSHGPHVHRWIRATFCPVKDEGGHVIEVIIVHEDVTEQRLASQARHESEARNAASVQAALDCIISMDSEGYISEWNPSAESTFGYTREEALGRLLSDLIVPPRLHKRHSEGLKRYMETGEGAIIGRKVEVTAVRANGEEFPVELAITPIVLGERRIFSGFLRDLTEIKAARDALQEAHDELEVRVERRTVELRAALEQLQRKHEQLEQLEILRDTLTGMIVHDLRTPLSSMMFGVQTVPLLGPISPAQQECLDVFTLGCKDSLAVINDLLDIGKIESGAFALHLESADAEELVSQALLRVVMLADIKNLHLSAQVEDDLPPFQADHEKAGRLFGNLLSNAIKFAPPSGTVTLGAHLSKSGTAIDFWVRDNGEGIPAEAFERIFEKFGQAETRLGNRETSSGLGLSFCKLIVEAHGGHIRVESHPGQGSLFTATFPLSPVDRHEPA